LTHDSQDKDKHRVVLQIKLNNFTELVGIKALTGLSLML
jgi:hypothetical protein